MAAKNRGEVCNEIRKVTSGIAFDCISSLDRLRSISLDQLKSYLIVSIVRIEVGFTQAIEIVSVGRYWWTWQCLDTTVPPDRLQGGRSCETQAWNVVSWWKIEYRLNFYRPYFVLALKAENSPHSWSLDFTSDWLCVVSELAGRSSNHGEDGDENVTNVHI